MKFKHVGGFSLLETVVYIGILATVAGVFSGIFQSVIKTQISETSQNEVTSQLNFAVQTMQRYIKNSSLIQFEGCGATTTLSLLMPAEAQSPTTIYAQNSKLYVQQGTGGAQAVTGSSVTVDSLEFRKLCNTGAKDTIEINIALSKTDSSTNNTISRSLRSAISRVNAVTFDSSLLPPADATYDVGTWPTLRWRNGSFSGYLKATELCIADTCQTSWNDVGASQWTSSSTDIYYTDGNVSIGTTTASEALTIDGNIGFTDGTTLGTAYPARGATLNISTTTLSMYGGTSATSTIELGFAYRPQTFVNAKCLTGAGSYLYRVGDGTNWSNNISCTTSSTSFNNFTTNNTFTLGEARFIQVGTFSGFTATSTMTIGIQDTAD